MSSASERRKELIPPPMRRVRQRLTSANTSVSSPHFSIKASIMRRAARSPGTVISVTTKTLSQPRSTSCDQGSQTRGISMTTLSNLADAISSICVTRSALMLPYSRNEFSAASIARPVSWRDSMTSISCSSRRSGAAAISSSCRFGVRSR